MTKTIEQLAKEAMEETQKPEFAELLKDEKNVKIFEILASISTEKEGKGPMEFTILLGRKCLEAGREEMRKELCETIDGLFQRGGFSIEKAANILSELKKYDQQ
jgi:hypothetical protein